MNTAVLLDPLIYEFDTVAEAERDFPGAGIGSKFQGIRIQRSAASQ